mmetsp:Transcript_29308/g.44718  ORF Transcript_29308/g.44718 Transcript_29308/m.44718 type:complete len:544 (+) Transcript_29308:97-1728(+)
MVIIQNQGYRCRLRDFLSYLSIYLLVSVAYLPSGTSFNLHQPSYHELYHKKNQNIVFALKVIGENHAGQEGIVKDLLTKAKAEEGSGFYVHIPYCRRRCRYCDFPIVPVGTHNEDGNEGFKAMDKEYCDALLDEIDFYHEPAAKKNKVSSIYFGGGTPSLAPISTLRAVLKRICRQFDVSLSPSSNDKEDSVEITMELDPGTFTKNQLEEYKQLGVNRISLGVQALNDTVLEQIGRIHRVKDVFQAVDMLKSVFRDELNYSLDLISGLPGVTLAQWAETLEIVVRDLKPTHLSIYDLQIEKGTVFGRWYPNNDENTVSENSPSIMKARAMPLPSPEECAYMYCYASGYLRHKGYKHYEISSYSQSDKRSRHNQIYWGYQPEWYAIGLGATSSFPRSHRFTRPKTMSDYLTWVKQQKQKQVNNDDDSYRNQPPWLYDANATESADNEQDEEEDQDQQLSDIIMTRLRTSDGLNLDWLEQHYSKDIVESVLDGAQLGVDLGLAKIEIEHEQPNNVTKARVLRLVDPKGFLFSNTIISSIFVEVMA